MIRTLVAGPRPLNVDHVIPQDLTHGFHMAHPRTSLALPSAAVIRNVFVGGRSKHELLAELTDKSVRLNAAGETLFANEKFATSAVRFVLETVQISMGDLGFAQGATIGQACERLTTFGLSLCPLELGPHLRLQYLDQPEGCPGQAPLRHCAPPGSITVASLPLSEDDQTPKGFYLRRIDGVLWLRGYWSGPEHVYAASDQFVFCRLPKKVKEP